MTITTLSTTVTILSIIIIIGLFLYRIYLLLNLTKDLENPISSLMDSDIQHLDENEENLLNSQLITYLRGFNKKNKTPISAHSIFSLENISSKRHNLRLLSGTPNTLVGLGVFFTFLGLAIGVGYFGLNLSKSGDNQTKAITEGINVLMGGMGTAFVSSVLGMFFSMIYGFFLKTTIGNLEHKITLLCNDFDSNYLMTQYDILQEQLAQDERHYKLMKNLFTVQNGDENINYSSFVVNTTNKILEESKKQTDAFSNFGRDMADAIYEALNAENQDGQGIATIIKNSIQDMTEKLEETMTNLLKDIQGQTGGAIVENANNAANQLLELTQTINQMPAIFNDIQEIAQANNKNTNSVLNQSQEILEKQADLIEKQKEAAQEIVKATQVYVEKRNEMNTSLEHIKNSSRALKESIENANESIETNNKHQLELSNRSNTTITYLGETLQNTIEFKQEFFEGLQNSSTDIDKILEQINTGLEQYHEIIQNNIQAEISLYANNVSTILKSLNGTITMLDEKIEDLTDVLNTRN